MASRWERANVQTGGLLDWAIAELDSSWTHRQRDEGEGKGPQRSAPPSLWHRISCEHKVANQRRVAPFGRTVCKVSYVNNKLSCKQ
jgi:hypothetical protein